MSEFWKPSEQGELYHYGVIGMKWGVHRAKSHWKKGERLRRRTDEIDDDKKWTSLMRKSDSHYDKASSIDAKTRKRSAEKLQKLDTKYQKKQLKADRAFVKAEQKANSFFSSERSAKKAYRKASKKQFKANKVAYKGKHWYEAMVKSEIDMTPETKAIGREFVHRVERQSKAMYNAQYGR